MLDAFDLDYAEVLAAVERWRPDAACLAAGDEYVRLAIRCWAGSLSDAQIRRRLIDLVGIYTDIDTPDIERYAAALALARHYAACGEPLRRIIAALAYHAADGPCWPNADEIAEIAIAAVRECSA